MSRARIDPARHTAAPAAALVAVILALWFAAVANALTPSTTTLTGDAQAPVAWAPISFAAKVTASMPMPGDVTPTGTVRFSGDGTVIGDSMLDASGVAQRVLAGGAGIHTLQASYLGDSTYDPSEQSIQVTIAQANSVTSVLTSANPAQFGTQINWFIFVDPEPPSDPPLGLGPSGSVLIIVDGVPEAQFSLGFGSVVVTVNNLAQGAHSVVIQYSGDVDYVPSDTSFTQSVLAPPSPPPSSAASLPAPLPTTAPVITRLTSSALLKTLAVPTTLRVNRAGVVTVGTARNPPLQSVTVDLAPAPGSTRGFISASRPLLGHVKVTVPAGARRSLKVKLSKAAQKTLRRRGQMRVQVRLTATDRSGRKVKATTTRKLKR